MKKLLIIIASALALHATAAEPKVPATPPSPTQLSTSYLAGSGDFPAIRSVGHRLIATFDIQAGANGQFGERLTKFLSYNTKFLIGMESGRPVETILSKATIESVTPIQVDGTTTAIVVIFRFD